MPEGLRGRRLHTSFLQRIPLAKSYHRHMMPLYPAATEGLDLRGFDLVISSDSGPVKGVRVDPGAVHICYCHSPMRYLYDGYEAYRAQMGAVTRAAFSASAGQGAGVGPAGGAESQLLYREFEVRRRPDSALLWARERGDSPADRPGPGADWRPRESIISARAGW